MAAAAGDFVYIPAGEIHVEANASATEPLVVRADPQLPRFRTWSISTAGPTEPTTCRRPC